MSSSNSSTVKDQEFNVVDMDNVEWPESDSECAEKPQDHGKSEESEDLKLKEAEQPKEAQKKELERWLNAHKENPFPTKGDKIMLAMATKMTLDDISKWFSSAIPRLLKEKEDTDNTTFAPKEELDIDQTVVTKVDRIRAIYENIKHNYPEIANVEADISERRTDFEKHLEHVISWAEIMEFDTDEDMEKAKEYLDCNIKNFFEFQKISHAEVNKEMDQEENSQDEREDDNNDSGEKSKEEKVQIKKEFKPDWRDEICGMSDPRNNQQNMKGPLPKFEGFWKRIISEVDKEDRDCIVQRNIWIAPLNNSINMTTFNAVVIGRNSWSRTWIMEATEAKPSDSSFIFSSGDLARCRLSVFGNSLVVYKFDEKKADIIIESYIRA